MTQKYFTVEEAQSLLPQIEKIMSDVRGLKRQIDTKISGWQEKPSSQPADTAMTKGQVDFLIGEINRQLEQVYQMGCLPKDLEAGLIDFPARIDGKEGYLCWKAGERQIAFWHGITEGFQGRKPLRNPIRKD